MKESNIKLPLKDPFSALDHLQDVKTYQKSIPMQQIAGT